MHALEKYLIDNNWYKKDEYNYSFILPNKNRVEVVLNKDKDLAKREIFFSDNKGSMPTPFWKSDFILYSLNELMQRLV